MPNELEQRFLAVVHANDARLRGICRVYARDPSAREDLHQEMLLQLWRSLPSFTGASSIDTWVYRVALNTALTSARRSRARRETPLEDEHLEIEVPVQETDGESGERLERMIACLAPVDRMLIMLYLDERSYREMAEVLGISESNVGVKLHRIRKLLAVWMAGEGGSHANAR